MLMVFVKKISYNYTEKHLNMDKWLNRAASNRMSFAIDIIEAEMNFKRSQACDSGTTA